MKRIVLTLALLTLALGSRAQMLFHQEAKLTADSVAVADSLEWSQRPRWSLWVGVAAGYSFHLMDDSPYASTRGYVLQIPLLLRYDIAPHWRLSTGLRYDFNWDPLKYRVSYSYDTFGNQSPLTIETTTQPGTQRARAFHSYLGVPLEVTWYPVAKERGLVSVSLDLFAAYAVSRYVSISEQTVNSYDPFAQAINVDGTGDRYGDPSMLPWKLEVGLTVSTDALGLIHGVRFYGNLLPTYREPTSGTKLYQLGMTLFL